MKVIAETRCVLYS